MRKLGIVFGLISAVLTVFLGLAFVPKIKESALAQKERNEKQERDLESAAALINAGKGEEALTIIHSYKPEIESLSKNGVRWLELFVQASAETQDVPQLEILFEFFPDVFKENETASLLVADSYIANNRLKDFQKIRSLWKDRETKVANWYVLDVDQLLLEGRRTEAANLLKSRMFKDKADVGRLIRLALLTASEDPKEAWKHLGEAYSKDPQNPDVRSYRAKLLESVGKYNLAHKEYLAATQIQPQNLFLKDQLAEFYLRQNQYPMALQVWEQALEPPSLDKIWVKALFWSKLTQPIHFDWERTPIPQGRLDPLIQYLMSLKPNEYWNSEKFEGVANGNYFLRTQQETFWLRLINALAKSNENEAMDLLKYNPYHTVSWFPELERVLIRVLNYRKNGTLTVDQVYLPVEGARNDLPKVATLPPMFAEIEEFAENGGEKKMPADLQNLLMSKEVFSAILLSLEWYEAGLKLHTMPAIPNDFPDWVAYNLGQALRENRGVMEALQFVSTQKPSPEMTLLLAELMIAGGDGEGALTKLQKIAKQDNDMGYRAAWLASLLYIDKKDWGNARSVIYAQPRLVNDISGQETLARIALLEGNATLADKLYAAIEKKSPEARSYLAKKAFEEKNWQKARELTEQLIKDYPDNATLKENLNIIIREQQGQTAEKA